MRSRSISGVSVKAIAAVLPSNELGMEFFSAKYGEKKVARVVKGTGIKSIRCSDGSTSDLIIAAFRHLLRNTDLNVGKVDGLIVVTQTPDEWSPGIAYTVHRSMGLETDCFVLDINAGCAGYVNSLVQAASLVVSGACENVVLCTGDLNTRLADDENHQIRMLFGDAASATLITRGDDILTFISGADGGGRHLLGVDLNYGKATEQVGSIGYLKMDGAAVMSFALRRVPEAINGLIDAMSIEKGDIDLFALHQPNELILTYLRRLLGVDVEKLPADVDGIGNTNSSSIPLLLSRTARGGDPDRDNVILCGYGVGLAWNAMHVDLSRTRIIEPFEVAATLPQ